METNVNYTIVGIFVLLLTGAIILAIVWLSSGFRIERYSTYKVYMQESVTGLSLDSPVEYNGVAVGVVKAIELNRRNPKLVEVLLDITNSTPISQGTEATLNPKGLTGQTYIALKDKSNDLRPLEAVGDEPYPIIKTSPSLFLRLDTALTDVSQNIRKVSEAFQTLLNEQNQVSIRETLANLQRITAGLAASNKKFTTILDNTSLATSKIMPLVQSSAAAVRTLETQTLPTTYRVLSNLDDLTRTLSEVAGEVRENPSVLVRGINRQNLGPGER